MPLRWPLTAFARTRRSPLRGSCAQGAFSKNANSYKKMMSTGLRPQSSLCSSFFVVAVERTRWLLTAFARIPRSLTLASPLRGSCAFGAAPWVLFQKEQLQLQENDVYFESIQGSLNPLGMLQILFFVVAVSVARGRNLVNLYEVSRILLECPRCSCFL
jgi:hypothetical protein